MSPHLALLTWLRWSTALEHCGKALDEVDEALCRIGLALVSCMPQHSWPARPGAAGAVAAACCRPAGARAAGAAAPEAGGTGNAGAEGVAVVA